MLHLHLSQTPLSANQSQKGSCGKRSSPRGKAWRLCSPLAYLQKSHTNAHTHSISSTPTQSTSIQPVSKVLTILQRHCSVQTSVLSHGRVHSLFFFCFVFLFITNVTLLDNVCTLQAAPECTMQSAVGGLFMEGQHRARTQTNTNKEQGRTVCRGMYFS